MEANSRFKLSFRFASDVGFRLLPLSVPCTVRDVRDHLKTTLNITSPLDVVVYSVVLDTNIEDSILPDDYNFVGGMRCLVKRVPESLVKVLLQSSQSPKVVTSLDGDSTTVPNTSRTNSKGSEMQRTDSPKFAKHLKLEWSDLSHCSQAVLASNHTVSPPVFNPNDPLTVHGELSDTQTVDEFSAIVNCKNTGEKDLHGYGDSLSSENSLQTIDSKSYQHCDTVSSSCKTSSETLLAPSREQVKCGDNASPSDENVILTEEDEEDERERILFKKIAEENGDYGRLYTGSVSCQESFHTGSETCVAEDSVRQGALGKSRESLKRRYFRNRNLSWIKNDSTVPSKIQSFSPTSSVGDRVRRPKYRTVGTESRQSRYPISVWERYLCHICGEEGHHIRNCPKGSDPKQQKKVKPATGFPRSWLYRIPKEQVAVVNCDVYSLPDGSFAILKDFTKNVTCHPTLVRSLKKESHQGDGTLSTSTLESHLHCTLCGHMFKNAVLTPCCGETFCESCILSRMNHESSRSICPSCHAAMNPNDLSSNKIIQDAVDIVLGLVPVSSKGMQNNSSTNCCIIDSNKHTLVSTKSSVSPFLERKTKMVKLDEAGSSNVGAESHKDSCASNFTCRAKLLSNPQNSTYSPGSTTSDIHSDVPLKNTSAPSILHLTAQSQFLCSEVRCENGNTESLMMTTRDHPKVRTE